MARKASRRYLWSGIAVVAAFAWAALPASAGAAPTTQCDPIDPALCMLPFPNDYFTVADPSTDTGRRVRFLEADMAKNADDVPIDPKPYNRNDGFSPGQVIVTRVPGLDNPTALANTAAVPITDLARYSDADAPIVVINADTLERHLIWAEIDSNATSPSTTDLLIHPAVNFDEGGHYIVALRNLKNSSGATIKPRLPFRRYRDNISTADPEFEARRPHMEDLFSTLSDAGIARSNLYLAWDFTVASEKNLSERALFLRNDAFAQLGDTNLKNLTVEGSAPAYTVTSVTNFPPCDPLPAGCQSGQDDRIARQVQGKVTVPCYLNQAGCPPGSRFAFQPGSNTPKRINSQTIKANFNCIIPRSAIDGGVKPARPSLYGHGLFGSANEVTSGNVKSMANESRMAFCATDWIGMSNPDLPNAISILQDLSTFPSLPDRMQQAYLDFMYLGRLMIHPSGFRSDPAFQVGGQSVLATQRLFFDGNSQGGIEGGALTSLAPDFTRSSLGVPAMNYSVLVQRSVDFDPFSAVLNPRYTNEIERPQIFSMLQMLWDRGDANGYAHHMTTDPFPNTPKHTVLLSMAFGDHQVTNWQTEVEARTIGARIRTPELDPGRSNEVDPYFGIDPIPAGTYTGSALVVWDTGPTRTVGPDTFGTDPSPPENVPNRSGVDPHGAPRNEASNREQKSAFLRLGGSFLDVCGADPCYAAGWTGPGP